MSIDNLSVATASIAAMFCGLICLAYAFTDQVRRSKRLIRFLEVVPLFWMALVYMRAVILHVPPMALHARLGFIVLIFFLIAEVAIDWRTR